MEELKFNPKDIIFSLDIGTRSVIGTVGIVKEKKFYVLAESYIEHQERAMIDGQIHDISLVANAVAKVKKELETELNLKLKDVAIAAAGRFLRTVTVKADMILDNDREIDREAVRSLELTAVKKAEERVNKQTEGKLYCVGYSVKSYYLNGYVITNLLSHKGESISAEVIATFLPRAVVDSLYAVMDKVSLNVVSLTLEPIAAMEAAIPKNLRLLNLALVDIGAGTSDIAITSKDSITAYGMVPLAGDEVTETIAHTYLVDFNTAERMKRECSVRQNIAFTDIMGFENEIASEEIIKAIMPTVEKIAAETSNKIIELNGGKSPNAVFLVGGGAHTPLIKEMIGKNLNLPSQRIGIKGRDSVEECVCKNNELGSTGVTVLGIALVSIRRLGNDFIDIFYNGNVISLFNSHKHTVMDVMLQAGVNPKVLIGRNGKNIRFTVNGKERIAFGSLAVNAVIKVNGKISSIDTEVKEGDKITIDYAIDGKTAAPKILEFMPPYNPVSFYLDNEIINLEPIFIINDMRVMPNAVIHQGDEVRIILPATFEDFKKFFDKLDSSKRYYTNGEIVDGSYIIKENDRITGRCEEQIKPVGVIQSVEAKKSSNEIKIKVNEEEVTLKGKEKYVFIDIFDFITFDLTKPRGNLMLILNDIKAGYYDGIAPGDNVKIYWE